MLKVQSLKGLNSGLNLKTLLEPHYSLFCVGGVLVVVCLFLCLSFSLCLVCTCPIGFVCGVKAVILKLPL